MNKGNRDFEAIAKEAVVHTGKTADEITPESLKSVAYIGVRSVITGRNKFKFRQSDGCFICGRSHPWHFCPDKRCPACSQKGHVVKDYPSKRFEGDTRKVMSTTKMDSGDDLSVALPIKINGKSVSALIDSGTGPYYATSGWKLKLLVRLTRYLV